MFTFANLMMMLARIVNIILTTAMILCFVINEISIIVMGFYSMEIHNGHNTARSNRCCNSRP